MTMELMTAIMNMDASDKAKDELLRAFFGTNGEVTEDMVKASMDRLKAFAE